MAAYRMLAVRRATFSPRLLLSSCYAVGSRKATTVAKDQRIPTPSEDFSSFGHPGYADDGYALGDYPNLPSISSQRREHFGWWDMQDRRNYNEPVHEDEDALNVWLWSEVECNDRYTRAEVLFHFMVAFGLLGLVGFASYLYDAPSRNPAAPREYPFNNLFLELGGDPEKSPTDGKHKIPNTALGA